jgi:hypothetical protein
VETRQAKLQRRLLRGGAVYFAALGLAHLVGIKLPLLFIYYDIPSEAYQDRIIGALALGWALWFWREGKAVSRSLLLAGFITLFALAVNTALLGGLAGIQHWLQLGLLGVYLVALASSRA